MLPETFNSEGKNNPGYGQHNHMSEGPILKEKVKTEGGWATEFIPLAVNASSYPSYHAFIL